MQQIYFYMHLKFLVAFHHSKPFAMLLLMAIDILQDFVGESIPIVDKNNCFIGAVTEGDIFSAFKDLTEA